MALHFVGFKDDRVWNARLVFGDPDFYHRNWDVRAKQEIVPGDVAIFATDVLVKKDGLYVVPDPDGPPHHISWDDSNQDILAYGGKDLM